jgi:hypothetical protein
VELLRRPRRTANTIPDFLSPNAPPNRLDILRGLVELSIRRRRRLTIVGWDRERWVVTRRGRWKKVCAHGAREALLGDPSTSPLGCFFE